MFKPVRDRVKPQIHRMRHGRGRKRIRHIMLSQQPQADLGDVRTNHQFKRHAVGTQVHHVTRADLGVDAKRNLPAAE